MPDIFGRTIYDYSQYEALRVSGKNVLQHIETRAAETEAPKHHFNALGSKCASQGTDVFDYAVDNLSAIRALVEEILFEEEQPISEYIPIVSDIQEGEKRYAHRKLNNYPVKGRWIWRGQPAPTARIRQETRPFYYGGVDTEWDRRDFQGAAFDGVALPTEVIEAAMIGATKHVKEFAFKGDASPDDRGLINWFTMGNKAVTRGKRSWKPHGQLTRPIPITFGKALSTRFSRLSVSRRRRYCAGLLRRCISTCPRHNSAYSLHCPMAAMPTRQCGISSSSITHGKLYMQKTSCSSHFAS